ncbi:MAG: PilZ domain-containing protein [Myxococcota bacterium]
MDTQPSVLLIDDGELDDIRLLLEEIGAEYSELRGGCIPDRVDPPRDLLITTGRRARLAEGWQAPLGDQPRPSKIAVVTEDSTTARRMLRLMGFDFLIRRPVHPEAIRLLLMRCLFSGLERRRHPRSPVGCVVSYRHGLRRNTAILSEISLEGLRLLSSRPLSVGTGLTLRVPGELLGGTSFSVRAEVVRCDVRRSCGERRELEIALALDPEDAQGLQHVEELLWTIASGPPSLSQAPSELMPGGEGEAREPAAATDQGSDPAPPQASDPQRQSVEDPRPPRRKVRFPRRRGERRRHQRADFYQKVVADSETNTRILVGRDLSSGGMRVDPDAELHPGQRLRLAIYGWADEAPLTVEAQVSRNEGLEGVGLEFDISDPLVSQRLERLVGCLPSVESLRDEEVGSVGTVVSRVLPPE